MTSALLGTIIICIISMILILALSSLKVQGVEKEHIAGFANSAVTGVSSAAFDNPICGATIADSEAVNCYDYMIQCEPQYYRDEIQTGNQGKMNVRLNVLKRMKVAAVNGKRLRGCSIPTYDFQNFELSQCPKNFQFNPGQGKYAACTVLFGARNAHKKDLVKGIHLKGINKTVWNEAITDFTDPALQLWTDGFRPPTQLLNSNLNFTPILPNGQQFPEIADALRGYEADYYEKVRAFSTAPVRGGYIMGRIWDKNSGNSGYDAIIPIVQKKFGNRYYSLMYRYTTKALKMIEIDNVSEWFSANFNWDNPKPNANQAEDPNVAFNSIEEFIHNDTSAYRERYLFDFMKVNRVRFSIIVEVFNKVNGKVPLISLEFTKYASDIEKGADGDICKWFGRFRLKDSPFTSNKKLIIDQYNVPTFKLNCGNQQAWTAGYVSENDINCKNHMVYMCIPTAKGKCGWQEWFRGHICVSNDLPINLAGPFADFEEFKKKYAGEYMNVWMCAETGDPFQNIAMTRGVQSLNPYIFRSIFQRKPGQSDEQWAMYIWKSISNEGVGVEPPDIKTNPPSTFKARFTPVQLSPTPPAVTALVNANKTPAQAPAPPPSPFGPGETAQLSDGFAYLKGAVKGKDKLLFEDYRKVCDIALLGKQSKRFAMEMGCIKGV